MNIYRWSVASRVAAAVIGGYAFTALFTIATPVLLAHLGVSRPQALFMATMASFLVYAVAIMAAFHARTATRAWVGMALFSLAPAIVVAVLGTGAGG